MASKTPYQTFQTDWQKTAAWAQQQGITPKMYMPIYQQDAQKLLSSGSGMSQSERIRAVTAGAGRGLTQLPSDNPDPTDIFGNLMKNAEQIFTGLMPNKIVSNIFGTVANTVEHPMAQLVNPLLDVYKMNTVGLFNKQARSTAMADFEKSVLGNNSAMAFVPGAVDVAHLEQGWSGVKYMAANPLTSVLDVLPIGKLTGGALARIGGDTAEAAAARAGVTTEELKGLGAGQLAWKIAKNSKAPGWIGGGKALGHLPATAEGLIHAKYDDQSTGEFISSLRNHMGAGADQADLFKAVRVHESVASDEMKVWLQPFDEAWGKLDRQSSLDLVNYMATQYHISDFRPEWEIMSDPKLHFTPDQQDAFQKTLEMDHNVTNTKLNAGDFKVVVGPGGVPEIYLAGPGSRAGVVERASARLNKANAALTAGKAKMNELIDRTAEVDHIMIRFFDQVSKFRENTYEAIKNSLPDLAEGTKSFDQLTEALPKEKRPGLLRSGRTHVSQANKKNLETFLGLDEKIEQRVYRGGGKDAIPFDGKQETWSPAEQSAWDESRKMLSRAKPSGDIPHPTTGEIRDLANKRLRMTQTIHDVKVHAPVPWQVATMLAELVGPGGILDQAIEAFNNQQWDQLNALTKAAHDKLKSKSFQSPTRSDQLATLDSMVNGLNKYSSVRARTTKDILDRWTGKKDAKGKLVLKGKGAYKHSVAFLVEHAETMGKQFLDISTANPPAVWDTYMKLEQDRRIMEREEGKRVAQEAIDHLRAKGVSETELTSLHENPAVISEMGATSAIVSLANHMLPNVETDVAQEVAKEIRDEVYELRQKGERPLFLATLHAYDRLEGIGDQLYNVTIGRTSISREQASFERSMDSAHGTIFNYQAGFHKVVREMITRAHEIDFQNNDVKQFLFDRSEVEDIIRTHFITEMQERGIIPDVPGGARSATYAEFVNQKLKDWGLKSYDPNGIFSTSHGNILGGKDQLIHKDIEKGLQSTFERLGSSTKASKAYDKATGLFRTSILGYSARFTAHIALGGTMLLALKSDPALLLHVNDGFKIMHALSNGKPVPAEIAAKFKLTPEDITKDKVFVHNPTQVGMADIVLQHAMAADASRFVIQERIAAKFGKDASDFKHPDFITHWLNVVPEANYRLTRWITNMQRTLALMDGLHKASRKESFHIDTYNETTKEIERVKHDMTPEQIMHEAMQHVERVMGDVRRMTPLEYNVLTRMFPFWGWSKHVMTYVLQYPGDHPYRAMFLSQMSRISNQEQPPGLPLRSQLLFFLGNPDQSGNVSAIDARAANPLRDTAQYASLSGWLSALNPVLTAPFAKVDPSITFGTNVLYPNISYSSLYGSNEAQPSGTWLGSVEGVVPELSGLDAALNLSGQYAYLQKGNRNAYVKKVMESVGFPWLPQQLNLRQIAATNEIDRYQQAKAAFSSAFKSGDFSQLKGYGQGPDPRNTEYDISPAELESVYNQTASGLGGNVSPGEVNAVTQTLPNPAY